MGERHVTVTVKIATEGRRCRDHGHADGPCPFLDAWNGYRVLFHEPLTGLPYDRRPACLALDGGGVGEPNGVGGAESSAALDPLLVGVDP